MTGIMIAWQNKLPALAYYWMSTRSQAATWQHNGVWLPAYRVTIDGLPIEGITENASGLTFNPDTGTLFAVINRPPQVAELTTEGRLLRLIPVEGIHDPEGISHVRGERYVIADEIGEHLYWVEIGPHMTMLDATLMPRLATENDLVGNKGFEGVSWDYTRERLFVVKEKSPLRVNEITGIASYFNGEGVLPRIHEWKPSNSMTQLMTDLSSLTVHEPTGNMLLLSHESHLVAEYAPDGTLVSIMPLRKGWHGLRKTVPQAEGIAMDTNGALYILSEPNLFYRFDRTSIPRWATQTSR